jgi:hypothetical protein
MGFKLKINLLNLYRHSIIFIAMFVKVSGVMHNVVVKDVGGSKPYLKKLYNTIEF